MRHCVGVYVNSCRQGYASIWTIRCTVDDKVKRVATVDVHPKFRTIDEFKGKGNSVPSDEAFRVVREWAKRENIHMAC